MSKISLGRKDWFTIGRLVINSGILVVGTLYFGWSAFIQFTVLLLEAGLHTLRTGFLGTYSKELPPGLRYSISIFMALLFTCGVLGALNSFYGVFEDYYLDQNYTYEEKMAVPGPYVPSYWSFIGMAITAAYPALLFMLYHFVQRIRSELQSDNRRGVFSLNRSLRHLLEFISLFYLGAAIGGIVSLNRDMSQPFKVELTIIIAGKLVIDLLVYVFLNSEGQRESTRAS